MVVASCCWHDGRKCCAPPHDKVAQFAPWSRLHACRQRGSMQSVQFHHRRRRCLSPKIQPQSVRKLHYENTVNQNSSLLAVMWLSLKQLSKCRFRWQVLDDTSMTLPSLFNDCVETVNSSIALSRLLQTCQWSYDAYSMPKPSFAGNALLMATCKYNHRLLEGISWWLTFTSWFHVVSPIVCWHGQADGSMRAIALKAATGWWPNDDFSMTHRWLIIWLTFIIFVTIHQLVSTH